MCAITGYLSKRGENTCIGRLMLAMLRPVSCRGPDSAGVALFGPPQDGFTLRIKLGESDQGDYSARAAQIQKILAQQTELRAQSRAGAYLRLEITTLPESILAAIEAVNSEVEVISAGHRLEIVKQVGSPDALDATYQVAGMTGTHGIGHTRLSTESRIDLSHSQPFWAHGRPDLATVHNGHITNYHKMRRRYEQKGVRFYTDNDSEIIGLYLRDRMTQGLSFEEALVASMHDFDGSFCYLAATETALAYVKDPFGLKPLMVAETDDWVAIATEEIALRSALGAKFTASEPMSGRLRVWNLPG
jgi:glutamate synthase domain-containing protein 1